MRGWVALSLAGAWHSASKYTWREGRVASNTQSRVTIHMAMSLDGFIARMDGRVDWLDTSDDFAAGETLDPGVVEAFLKTIDSYVMGSRTYETALDFKAKGFGWAYGDTRIFVLTSRDLPRTRDTVEFHSGDLAQLVNLALRPMFHNIWVVGGGVVAGACLRLGLADEIRCSILPIVIGKGKAFFEEVGSEIALHLVEVRADRNGTVELRYEVRGGSRGAIWQARGPGRADFAMQQEPHDIDSSNGTVLCPPIERDTLMGAGCSTLGIIPQEKSLWEHRD